MSQSFPPYEAGTGNVCLHNSLELAKRGHIVEILTTGPSNSTDPIAERVTLKRIKPIARRGNAALLPGLARHMRHCAVIHLHLPFYGGAEWALLGSRISARPLVVTYHNDVTLQGRLGNLPPIYDAIVTKNIARHCARWIAPSLAFASNSRISRYLAPISEKVVEIPNGVDISTFSTSTGANDDEPISIAKRDLKILFVGALDSAHYYKGLELLMKAFSNLEDRRAELVVVGDGELSNYYSGLANKLEIQKRVRFLGKIQNQSLPDVYRDADIVVVPSIIAENQSLVALEAMSSGRPLIVSRYASTQSLVQDGINGVLFTSENEEDLRQKIEMLMDDGHLRKSLGRRAREHCVSRHSWDTVGDALDTLFKEIEDAYRTEDDQI